MATIWFAIVCLMFSVFVVLDGFDFGAGVLHLIVAKTETERRSVLAAIGPLWDGNEVWLIAGGGVLFFAFPRAYAASFCGFYLPLTMALWLLILRGVSIEFRGLESAPLWRSFWDGVFSFSSCLLAIVLGAALGNVIRGVPLEKTGYFAGPLFTNFQIGTYPGVLDWYTCCVGAFALVALSMHGALFLRMKLEGEIQDRCSRIASRLWVLAVVLGTLTTVATYAVQPVLYSSLVSRPWSWLLAVAILISILAIPWALRKRIEHVPFYASCTFLLALLSATAVGMYPWLIRSTVSPGYDLTVWNASAGALSLRVGLAWWLLAIALAIGYFVYLFRTFRGKVKLGEGNYH